jgi:hypothetical protein
MTDPGSKRKFTFIDLILILLFFILIYVLYVLFGGDLAALTRLETYTAGESPFDRLVGSLSSFGQGLQDAFRGMLR